jgi:hypothetical protein
MHICVGTIICIMFLLIEKCASFTVSNGGIIISDTYPLSTGEYIAPTTVTIHCPHGTIPDGSQTVQCQLGGTWNDTVTTCFSKYKGDTVKLV